MQLEEILTNIQTANDKYRVLKLSHVQEQSEILRDLSCAYTDLSILFKREYREQWLDVYNTANGSNAAKERIADTEVKEYDLINDVLKAVDIQIKSLITNISANKPR